MATQDIVRGSVSLLHFLNVTLSPTSVSNASTIEQTFTVTGLKVGDYVSVVKPTSQVGLGITNSRVSTAGVLAIQFMNCTAATITPTASEIYVILYATTKYQPPLTVA